MSASTDSNEAGLDPRAQRTLEILRGSPGKGFTVMDIYGSLYTEEEKAAHLQGPGGVRVVFQEIQGWLNEFVKQGHVTLKMVSASIFFTAT